MTPEQYEHMDYVIDYMVEEVTEYYEKHQAVQSVELWKKKDLLDQAIENAAAQLMYLISLKQQNDKIDF